MRPALLSLILLALTACKKDETISAFVPPGSIWRLAEVNGQAFPASATITFPEPGKIVGKAPCNNYSTSQNAPYPWFEAGPIQTTKIVCPELSREQTFVAALASATLVEVSGKTLILSNDTGLNLIFTTN
ncbi:MAG: META domain-containing protein [Rhodobacteraceae bacterium]|nr:META domain-containing protein [Paracoccaceae bacterium]